MTFRPLTVGVDLNKVILDTLGALHRLVCEVSGADIPPEQFSGKNCIGQSFSTKPGGRVEATAEHYKQAKYLFFETRRFCGEAQELPGAAKTCQRLVAEGHTIKLVTDVRGLPESWLRTWWHELKFPKNCEMHLTRGCSSKRKFYADCDVVIDNSIEQLLPLLKTEARLLLMLPAPGAVGSAVVTRPRDLDGSIITVRGWDQIYESICKIQESAAA